MFQRQHRKSGETLTMKNDPSPLERPLRRSSVSLFLRFQDRETHRSAGRAPLSKRRAKDVDEMLQIKKKYPHRFLITFCGSRKSLECAASATRAVDLACVLLQSYQKEASRVESVKIMALSHMSSRVSITIS